MVDSKGISNSVGSSHSNQSLLDRVLKRRRTASQQRAARTFTTSLAVTAGAGAGKTAVLVDRYLNHLAADTEEGRASVEQILAITFTEKAALEMLERIRQEISKLVAAEAEGIDSVYWKEVKEQLVRAQVSTIHSFCAGLLRRFPVEAQIDPEVVILSPVKTAILLEEAVWETLSQSLKQDEDQVKKLLQEYGFRTLCRELQELYQQLQNRGIFVDLFDLTRASWAQKDREMQELIREITILLEELLQVSGITAKRTLQSLQQLRDGRAELVSALRDFRDSNGLMEKEPTEEQIFRMERALQSLEWLQKLCSGNKASAVKKYFTELKEKSIRLAAYIEATAIRHLIPHLCNLLVKLDQNYQKKKKRELGLDYEDLQRKTLDLLQNYKEIRDYCQQQFRFVMVDEFQDTNWVQGKLVSLLIGEEEESSVEVQLQNNRLFIVGDPKQSIYRFRGAEVRIFGEMKKRIARSESISATCCDVETPVKPQIIEPDGLISLQDNFRTKKPLIDFVNWYFSWLMKQGGIDSTVPSLTYESLEARRPGHDYPHVEAILIPRAEDTEENIRQEAEAVAARIRRMVDAGEKLVWEQNEAGEEVPRPVQYRDITCLLRVMNSVQEFEQAFQAWGIPYYVVGGKSFWEKQEIQDILQVLRYTDNPYDQIALAGILRSPLFGLSDETLLRLVWEKGNLQAGFWETEECGKIPEIEWEQLLVARRCLQEWRRVKDRVQVRELIERIIKETHLEAVLLAEPDRGRQKVANLKKLIELASEFERENRMTLGDFLQHYELLLQYSAEETEALVASEQGDAVQIMTVHKAKGLEFPVVIVSDLGRQFRKDSPVFVVDRDRGLGVKYGREGEQWKKTPLWEEIHEQERQDDLEELKRLFYVATTRARDLLILSGVYKPDEDYRGIEFAKLESWMDWLCKRLEISSGDLPAELEYPGGKICLWSDGKEIWESRITEAEGKLRATGRRLVEAGKTTAGKDLSAATIDNEITVSKVSKETSQYKYRIKQKAMEPGETRLNEIFKEGIAKRKEFFPLIVPLKNTGQQVRTVSVTPLMVYQECPRQYYYHYYLHFTDIPFRMPAIQEAIEQKLKEQLSREASLNTGVNIGRTENEGGLRPELRITSINSGITEDLGPDLPLLSPAQRGTVIHRIIEGLDQPTLRLEESDREKFKRVVDGLVDEALKAEGIRKKQDLQQVKKAILESGPLRNYLDSKVREWTQKGTRVLNEMPFIFKLAPDLLIEGVIDRLIFDLPLTGGLEDVASYQPSPGNNLDYSSGKVRIIDFKTNRVAVNQVNEVANQYRLQMYLYTMAVKRIFFLEQVESYLYFLEPNVLVPCTLTPEKEKSTAKWVKEAVTCIDSSRGILDFPRKPDNCKQCPYQAWCTVLEDFGGFKF